MKKILTVLAMFLMLTGKANAKYENIKNDIRAGKLSVEINVKFPNRYNVPLEIKSEKKVWDYMEKIMKKYQETLWTDKSIDVQEFADYVMEYTVHITITKTFVVHPKFELTEFTTGDNFSTTYKPSPNAGQQLIVATVVIPSYWDKSLLDVINMVFYNNDSSLEGLSQMIVDGIFQRANNDYPTIKKNRKEFLQKKK